MKKIALFTILFFFMVSFCYGQQEYSENSLYYIKEARRLNSEGKTTEANTSFQKAVELDPKNKEALLGLGKTFMYLDKNKEAEDAFNKILKLSPDDTTVMFLLAKVYAYTNRYNEAINLYQKALGMDPKNKEIKIGLAEVYLWAGFRKKSISQYEELLREDPRNKGVYKGLAEIYIWDNRLKDAERIYIKALKITPDDIDLHLGLAKIYILMVSWSKAQEEYERVLKVNPKNSDAIKGLDNIRKLKQPRHETIFRYLREVDANDWRASTITYGYKGTKTLEHNNNIFASYYVSDNRETGYTHEIGNMAEIGGKYTLNDYFDFLGSANMRNYSHGINFFGGADLASVFKYLQKNTLVVKYSRDIFDVLDGIRSNRYIVESNIYFGNYINLNDSFSYSDYSDNNWSNDQYHGLNITLSKKKPDLSIGFVWRHRDFKNVSPLYYSPKDLDSVIYSVYCGRVFNKNYIYGLFKFSHNSDHNDTYYYLFGNDYALNDNCSIVTETSYFNSEIKYHAINATVSFRLRF